MRAAQLAYNYSVNILTTGLGNWRFKVVQLPPWRFKITEVDSDSEAPTLLSAVVTDLYTVVLTFSEALNEAIIPENDDFIFDDINDPEEVEINGNIVTLTFTTTWIYNFSPSFAYIHGSNILQDLAGNEVAPFSADADLSIFPNGSCTDLLLSEATSEGFRADWINESTDETAIVIYRSEDGINFTPISLPAGTETYTFEDLTASTLYYSKVRASKNGFFSGYTDTESISTASGEEAETTALVGAMTTPPSTALRTLINTTIKGLKDDGVFTLADCLYIRGVHDSQAASLNWIKRAHDSTLVNAPTFTAKEGFKGNGSTKYINNNYTPSTDAVQLSRDSATIVIMHKLLGTTSGRMPFGVQNTSTVQRMYFTMFEPGNDRMFFNHQSAFNDNCNFVVNEYLGYVRSGNSGLNVQGYVNGNTSGAGDNLAGSTTSLPAYSMFELALNLKGTAGSHYNGQTSFMFIGAALNATQMLALYNRVSYFYANVGGTF